MSLILLELGKIFRRKGTYIVGTALILLVTVLGAVVFYLGREKLPFTAFKDHPIDELLNGIVFSELVLFLAIHTLLPALVGIVTASAFAGEFRNGRIRTVSLRPVSRWGVFFSKLLSLSVYSYFLLASLLVISYAIGAFMFGPGNDTLVYGDLFLGKGAGFFIMEEGTAWQRLFLSYLFAGFALIALVALFLMTSAIFGKKGWAAGLPLGIYFGLHLIKFIPFTGFLLRYMPNRFLMIWRYVMAVAIAWVPFRHDGLYLLAFTLAFIIIGAVVFRFSDL